MDTTAHKFTIGPKDSTVVLEDAIHFIVVRFVNKGIAVAARQLAGSVSAAGIALIVYFLLPAIAVMVSYILAKFLVRFLPGVWRVLSGGRKLEDRGNKNCKKSVTVGVPHGQQHVKFKCSFCKKC